MIEVFPKETLDTVSKELKDYFRRKRCGKMSPRDAEKLIDYVSGPTPRGGAYSATDYTKPRVSGGGTRRPSDGDIEAIMNKYSEEKPNEWDEVFARLMKEVEDDPQAKGIVQMAFRDGLSGFVIAEEGYIGRTTYFRKRRTILEKAALIAVEMGVLEV